ncbi:MAG: MutS-related protein [Candidatus Dormibacteria bacterium]
MTEPIRGGGSLPARVLPFTSILFADDHVPPPESAAATTHDLNLDQIFTAMSAARGHDVGALLASPLTDRAAIAFRHEVFRDLESELVRHAVDAFVNASALIWGHREQAESLRHPLQKERWLLEAVEVYVEAIRGLVGALTSLPIRSRGFEGLRAYLTEYAASAEFVTLSAEQERLTLDLAMIRYTILIRGNRVTVGPYAGESDRGVEVHRVFSRFGAGASDGSPVSFADSPRMNHVEAKILERVAAQHPEAFGLLHRFAASHQSFFDPMLARFDREVQLYLAYLDLIEPLRASGLPFCYPALRDRAAGSEVVDAFDLALAAKLTGEGRPVVLNDFRLDGQERIMVVTGPNQGGKTTFARMVGQVHYLCRLGLPVPGRRARLLLCDHVYTHFEREEDVSDLRSKLQDEVIRISEILGSATETSVVIMNESLNSTTVDDALILGQTVLAAMGERGLVGVYVTFIDELAELGQPVVSLVGTIRPDDKASRTFKVVRQAADGRAYALAIAEKYGLTLDQLTARLPR